MNDLGRHVGQQSEQQGQLLRIASFRPMILPHPSAWLGHLPFAAWIIQEVRPRTFVELGTHHGHSYFAFCQSVVEAGLRTQCFAVDTWSGDLQSGYYGEEVFSSVSGHNEKHYESFSYLLRMSFDEAASRFADGSIDLLHIDGLHGYDAVRHDFDTWLPKLAPGAVVMLHDTAMRAPGFGVRRFWEELIDSYPRHIEFRHACGLGVLQVGTGFARPQLPWLMPDAPERATILRYFEVLGAQQEERFALEMGRERIRNLEGEVDRLNGIIVQKEQDLKIADSAMADLVAREDEKSAKIAMLSETVAEGGAKIAALYASTSWRVTRPLRAVRTAITRIQRPAICAVTWIRDHGGMRGALDFALDVYRHEGLRAVLKRVGAVVGAPKARPVAGSEGYDRNDYAEWIRRYDALTDEAREGMRKDVQSFRDRPLISVIMPAYNSNRKWLEEAIASVQSQIYPHWELCIADDASTDRHVREMLQDWTRHDTRIRVVHREKNGHICAASNSALGLASGSWIALLDHDDVLHESALYWVAREIECEPEAGLIYTDEDKIDLSGGRTQPYWKSDWNRDLFYSHNMICHLGVYRKDIVMAVGGFREGLEGAQDYDLALRVIERLEPTQIRHIPRVLYHWRQHVGSTALSSTTKPYAMPAGTRALNDHFTRRGVAARAELTGEGYRVRYEISRPWPMVSLIILTKDRVDLLRRCVDSILTRTDYGPYEILVVDNGSSERETLEYLGELQRREAVRVVQDSGPFNFSALNNRAVLVARGSIVGLLNNDTEVISKKWLQEMVSFAVQEDVGAVGARLWYPDETLQHAGVILGIGGVAGHPHRRLPRWNKGFAGRADVCQSLSAVTAACLVVRKAVYEEVGGFNESDLPVAFNDVDFCLRVREAGYRNIWTPYADLYHYESATRGLDNRPDKRRRFSAETAYMKTRWGELLRRDPAYNPNLTLDFEDFSLAWPPRVELVAGEREVEDGRGLRTNARQMSG